MGGVVFISHSSEDRKPALEARNIRCWISSRDIGPGENFQEAIVGAIAAAAAAAMVLVFTGTWPEK